MMQGTLKLRSRRERWMRGGVSEYCPAMSHWEKVSCGPARRTRASRTQSARSEFPSATLSWLFNYGTCARTAARVITPFALALMH